MCCPSALYERFSSRGEADFADKLLSAMRYEFGGHLEKPPRSVPDDDGANADAARQAHGLTSQELDQLAINTIRTLSIDAVQQANSGHPGTPMALAPLVYTIWNRVMRFDPKDPIWPNRDRFVLSNGHASMLLWSVLHLTGTQAVNADYERVGQAVGHARRHPPLPPARQQGAGASGISSGSRASKRPQVRWVRASPPVSAWRSRASGLPAATTGRASTSSTTTSTPSAATAA